MGIDPDLAVNDLDGEFHCLICYYILQNPVEIRDCEHMFCKECIGKWIQERDQIKNFITDQILTGIKPKCE